MGIPQLGDFPIQAPKICASVRAPLGALRGLGWLPGTFCLFWTKILDYGSGTENFCIFTLGGKATFSGSMPRPLSVCFLFRTTGKILTVQQARLSMPPSFYFHSAADQQIPSRLKPGRLSLIFYLHRVDTAIHRGLCRRARRV